MGAAARTGFGGEMGQGRGLQCTGCRMGRLMIKRGRGILSAGFVWIIIRNLTRVELTRRVNGLPNRELYMYVYIRNPVCTTIPVPILSSIA